jgi:hypothetical protein
MRCAARFALLLLVLASFPQPAAAGEPQLDGMYSLTGLNPDGSEYRGVVKIVSRGEGFLVSWIFPRVSGETVVATITSVGVGLVKGEMLAVSYYGQDATGVVLYRIEEGGQRLTGAWVSANDKSGTVHYETLRKLPAVLAPAPPPAESQKETRPRRPVLTFGQAHESL